MGILAKSRSFRVRIALFSTLLSGAVLAAFGLWTWEAVQRTSLQRIDERIRSLGDRYLTLQRGSEHWKFVSEALSFAEESSFILLVIGRDGQVVYRSGNWPADLSAKQFPTPAQAGFDEGPLPFDEPPEPPIGPMPGPGGRDRGPSQYRIDAGDTGPQGQQWRMRREAMEGGEAGTGRGVFPPEGPHGPLFGQVRREPPPPPIMLRTFTHNAPDHRWRVGVMSNPAATMAFGLNLAPYMAEMGRLRRLYLLAAPCALIIIACSGWWLAQRALRPVQALTQTAERITAQGLDQRIASADDDIEFARLIHVFNDMLDRLETSFKQAVRFSADAAHELKTPLTILQGELNQALQVAPPGSEQQQTLGRLLEEVQRLKSITRKLLLLALADSGRLKPHAERCNLSEMIEGAADDIGILAPGIRVDAQLDPDVWVDVDRDLFRQVIQNLISNAVKYNVPDGNVAIELRQAPDHVRFSIANSGPGIPPVDRHRVFERFYRADKARNRRVDGTGLGLSLAREIVRAHRGELVLSESTSGRTTFTARLPLRKPVP